MRTSRYVLAISACAALAGATARADVRLPAVFGDHMVLQRQAQVPIWGWADSGEEVRVRADWMDADAKVTADPTGRWRVAVQTPAAGGPHTLTVAGKNTIEFKDVLIGEVWVCSGQSNMEMAVGHLGAAITKQQIEDADQPKIRLFNVQNEVAPAPKDNCTGSWTVCTPQTVKPFSAAAYFFARTIRERMEVPIGLIESDWGGTPIEAWMSERGLAPFPEFARELALAAAERKDPGNAERENKRAASGWRERINRLDPGMQGRWMDPGLDDSGWETMKVPASWSGPLAEFDGEIWFRRTVEIPELWAGKELTLELGPIDDVDDTYVNGELVGGMWGDGDWNRPRRYTVPGSAVRGGRLAIAVRVIDVSGPGGINGKPEQVRVGPASGGEPISLAGEWRYKVGPEFRSLPGPPVVRSLNANTPTSLYNGMIAPIAGYGIRGALWYQGESNRSQAFLYRSLFPAMIADWRAAWGQGDFPFYFVQIAPFDYGADKGETAELREAQMMALKVPNTGMAVTMDIGNLKDIHPTAKQEVGRRLALWALANTYGQKGFEYSGPLYDRMKVEEGEKGKAGRVRLMFEHLGRGLEAKAGTLKGFTIAGEDKKFVPAMAKIDGDSVLVWSDEVKAPLAVRYGWGTLDVASLMNKDGLPAPSFRTDSWPGVTEGSSHR